MIILDTNDMTITMHRENIVLVDGKRGTQITKEKSEKYNAIIENAMNGPYGMIINRKEDYSIAPVQVYNVLNSTENLRCIAIVAYRNITLTTIETEKLLSENPLESFISVGRATEWLSKLLTSP